MTAFKKIQIGFDEDAHAALNRLKKRTRAITIAEVVRHALGLYEWALDENASGRAVGSFREGEPLKEVVLARSMKGVQS